tara:strand:+ start:291 stop:782 length:492 start_codon:yes stop_codon:yes gene_type:complete
MGAKQDTTVTGESASAKGKRDTERLKAAYASSPLYGTGADLEPITEDGTLSSPMRAWYDENVLTGDQDQNPLFGNVRMDYGNAPNIAEVTTGGGGLPAGPRVPSTASPGEGNGSEATALPEVPAVGGHEGSLGSTESPNETSPGEGNFKLTNLPVVGKSAGSS